MLLCLASDSSGARSQGPRNNATSSHSVSSGCVRTQRASTRRRMLLSPGSRTTRRASIGEATRDGQLKHMHVRSAHVKCGDAWATRALVYRQQTLSRNDNDISISWTKSLHRTPNRQYLTCQVAFSFSLTEWTTHSV